jgi:uncharacterized protein (DUF1499 family)
VRWLGALALVALLLGGCERGQKAPLIDSGISLRQHLTTHGRATTAPRTWLIAPKNFPGKPDETAPEFDLPAQKLGAAFDTATAALPDIETVGKWDMTRCLIAETPLMRFRDDVCADIIALDGARSTLALYSASRIGYYDFKTNRDRLHRWLDGLRDEVARAPK